MILRSLLENLAAGARLALFLRLRPDAYRTSPLDYAVLLAFNFVLWVAAAAVRAGFDGEFDASAVQVYLAGIPLVLGAALLVALAYREPARLMPVAIALTASDWIFELAGLALPAIAAAISAGAGAVGLIVLLGWIWIVALRAVAVAAGTGWRQFLRGAAAVSAMIAIGLFAFPRVEVWRAPPDDPDPEPLAEERLFHLQGQLIERALGAIAPGRPGVAETYFVGFAPDSSQDVFLKEMRFVRRLFDERFGAAGRSIALASSRDALEELPIASVTNLARAIGRVAEQMNADEDLLFLFVTAHGSPDHRLSAVQPPLELAPLTPTALARLLHDSGIRWRVVVVSACYSGGYIEPLRDDNTVVITASAPDRNSFGCEPDRDFTYFGQAYFRDALAKTRSFTKAFELAKEIVAKQEAEEKLLPSLPQMWVGPAIAERLNRLADQPDQK